MFWRVIIYILVIGNVNGDLWRCEKIGARNWKGGAHGRLGAQKIFCPNPLAYV